jgi:hypothetical protein
MNSVVTFRILRLRREDLLRSLITKKGRLRGSVRAARAPEDSVALRLVRCASSSRRGLLWAFSGEYFPYGFKGARSAPRAWRRGPAGRGSRDTGVLMIGPGGRSGRPDAKRPREPLAWARPLRLSAFGAQRATARP